MLAVQWEPTLLGVAAIITSLSGVVTAIIGARRRSQEAREKADEECHNRLRRVRAESEELAQELHRIRMRTYPAHSRDERPEEGLSEGLDEERWSHLE